MISKMIKAVYVAAATLALTPAFADGVTGVFGTVAVSDAQVQNSFSGEDVEKYTPTIWIDPDGCEHWVFDDGFEGFMSPHRNRDGSPVCRRQEVCSVIPSDTLFSTNKAVIPAAAKQQLQTFFGSGNARAYLVYGHTDARASDAYNMDLSQRRANAVAQVARLVGANVVDVRGFGERRPVTGGNSAAAYQQNRRVEIICLQ